MAPVETILKVLPTPALVHTEDRVSLINDAFAHAFAIDARTYVGQSCDHLLRKIKLAPPAIKSIVKGDRFSNLACPCSPKNVLGPSLLVSQIDLGPAAKGDSASFLVLMTDTSRQRLIEEEKEALHRELLEAQKLEAIGKLASGIAHEINTPSQYIGDNLSFLSDAYEDLLDVSKAFSSLTDNLRGRKEFSKQVAAIDRLRAQKDMNFLQEEIPKAIAQARDGIRQISGIVLATKDFSYPTAKEKSPVDLNRALENTITISRNEWKYVCRTVTSLDSDLPPVPCLAGELNQVFLNLVVNSAHAIAAAGRNAETGMIKVETSVEDSFAVVRISDNGTGIEASIRDKVFDPFFTTKEVGKGTGQGLAIARDIVVTKHGGTIGFETVPGKGTTFTVKLPLDVPIDGMEGSTGDDAR